MNSLTIIGGVVFALLLLFIYINLYFQAKLPTIWIPKHYWDEVRLGIAKVWLKRKLFNSYKKECDRNAPETEKDKILDQTPKLK